MSGAMENRKSETLSIRLTAADKAEFVRIAKEDMRPPAQLAAIIIKEWLERQAKARKKPVRVWEK
jgi:hypothetical protein